MENVLDLADNWLMLVRIELGVTADNEKAISLYQSFGFEIEGTKKYAIIKDGKYADLLIWPGTIFPLSSNKKSFTIFNLK